MGPVRLNTDFLVPKFLQLCIFTEQSNKNLLYLSRAYPKATLNQPQGEQETVVRTGDESRNHTEATSAQSEIWKDYNIGFSA